MKYVISGQNIMTTYCDTKEILVEFVRINFGDAKAEAVHNWNDEFDGRGFEESFVDPDKMFSITSCLKYCDTMIKISKSHISEKEIKSAEKILVDNGIDMGEAEIVLQAIGYVLLDTELYP